MIIRVRGHDTRDRGKFRYCQSYDPHHVVKASGFITGEPVHNGHLATDLPSQEMEAQLGGHGGFIVHGSMAGCGNRGTYGVYWEEEDANGDWIWFPAQYSPEGEPIPYLSWRISLRDRHVGKKVRAIAHFCVIDNNDQVQRWQAIESKPENQIHGPIPGRRETAGPITSAVVYATVQEESA